jgi:hypothetical protein
VELAVEEPAGRGEAEVGSMIAVGGFAWVADAVGEDIKWNEQQAWVQRSARTAVEELMVAELQEVADRRDVAVVVAVAAAVAEHGR